ncbi:hypothetical protein JCM19237_3783 [Photobacterium aphoticum]|uniref:Uncharacterized protein n=1 Tax=Photobacterium aphoticum TaxID=754436 RepID=A0A090QZW3_9GAMM|nr:hypothetical protein JCM19237_3783 [Photobacterium aphoticum]
MTFDGDLPSAFAGQAVTLTLADEIDISVVIRWSWRKARYH